MEALCGDSSFPTGSHPESSSLTTISRLLFLVSLRLYFQPRNLPFPAAWIFPNSKWVTVHVRWALSLCKPSWMFSYYGFSKPDIFLFLDIYIYKLWYQPDMLTNRDFYGIYKVLLGKINISLFLSLCFIVSTQNFKRKITTKMSVQLSRQRRSPGDRKYLTEVWYTNWT